MHADHIAHQNGLNEIVDIARNQSTPEQHANPSYGVAQEKLECSQGDPNDRSANHRNERKQCHHKSEEQCALHTKDQESNRTDNSLYECSQTLSKDKSARGPFEIRKELPVMFF